MKRIFLSIIMSLVVLISWGQDDRLCFNHLELSANLGTTGLGADFSMPISESFQLRSGFTFMPHFKSSSTLDVFLNNESVTPVYNDEGNRTDRMGKLIELMESFTGYKMDEEIGIYMKPTIWNVRLLVDWFPSDIRDWHVTAGIFIGPSEIARICNNQEEMHTLTGMGIYNGMYEKIQANEPILTIGGQTVNFPDNLKDKVTDYGRMSIPVGKKLDGSEYSFDPDSDGLVKTSVKTNCIRPYIGGGYTYWFDLEHRTSVSFDLGILLWGGRPSIRTADGVDLARDMQEVYGTLGRWVDFYSSLRVMPMVEIRFCRRLF